MWTVSAADLFPLGLTSAVRYCRASSSPFRCVFRAAMPLLGSVRVRSVRSATDRCVPEALGGHRTVAPPRRGPRVGPPCEALVRRSQLH